MPTVFTVGHSNFDWSTFQRLLDQAEVGVILDVRSNPASRLPHFNRTVLKERLNCAGVGYVFLGLELGGRPRNGSVPDYEQMAAGPLFAEGVARVEEMAARTRPALMCSEREPLKLGRQTCQRNGAFVNRPATLATPCILQIVACRGSLQCRLRALVGCFCCHVSNKKSATVLAECMDKRAMRASIRLNPRSRP